jgi:P4 family phage/plasmid primase-like protien
MHDELALLCGAGLALVPIPPINGKPTKAPTNKGWNFPRTAQNPGGYSSDLNEILACGKGFNFGLYHGASNTLALDLDDVALARRVFEELTDFQLMEYLESEQRAEVKSPKANRGKLLFKLPEGFKATGVRQFKHDGKVVFELRSGNCQDVIHGQHPEGGDYQFIGNPAAIPEAPPVLLDMLQHWDDWKRCLDSVLGIEPEPPPATSTRRQQGETHPDWRDPIREFNQSYSVGDVLQRNGYRQKRRDRFIRPGSESKAPGAVILRNYADGIERVYSHGGDVLNDGRAHDAFDCFRLLEHSGDWDKSLAWNPDITKHNQRLYRQAQNVTQAPRQSIELRPGQMPFAVPSLAGTDARDGTHNTRPLTELGNAHRLYDVHGGNIHYVHNAKAWLYWHDGAWSWDIDGAMIRSLTARLPAQIYNEGALHLAESEYFAKWSRNSQKETTIEAAVSLLEDFEQVRLPLALIDADSFCVGIDNGRSVVDLKTGNARPAQQSDFITKSLNVGQLGQSAKAKRWRSFLAQVFNEDDVLIVWIQRWCGYMLTGSTNEQIFVFCYGVGANGKSVFADTLRFILGDYARSIAPETLTETKRQAGGATPDIADLIGARLAMSSETEDGTALAESLVKSLVAGDTMTARRLYSAPVQFTPQFKLMMLGNHKPVIRGNDYGIWRRVRMIPFNRTFKPEERDPDLLDKLKAEAAHIFAWMVEGCLEWQKHGLRVVPPIISQATAEYQEEQDVVGRWMSENCILEPRHETSSTDLYQNYRVWCFDNGFRPLNASNLGRRLTERLGRPRKSNGKMLYQGIGLCNLTIQGKTGKQGKQMPIFIKVL